MAWVDMETTGLEASKDVPLELGIILTDEWGNKINLASWLVWEENDISFQAGVKRGHENEFVEPMHTASGLWSDLENSPDVFSRDEVDDMVVDFLLDNHVELGTLPMCGNSIGSLDRPFTLVHFPRFNKALNYRNVDMSSLKEICKMVNPGLFENLKPIIGTKADATHRVLDDCDASIREYQTYLEEFLIVGD